ncbi:DUF4876 domain-containing protein [Sphingobacterium sp. WOUb80]|uniref:DUF4876 domain-containing protein n=1 Tax=Sphingobacterium sp. WOUb80 TaxID=3234028 RepID=UPI003CF149ED
MKRNQLFRLAALGLLVSTMAVTSCQKDVISLEAVDQTEALAKANLKTYNLNFSLSPKLAGKELLGARAIFKNTATGETFTVNAQSTTSLTAELPEGSYEAEISGYIKQNVKGKEKNTRVSAIQKVGPSFRSAANSAALLTLSANPFADLKIEEIYFPGSGTSIRDQFFKITNTAAVNVDPSGLVIMEGSFLNTTQRVYTPSIIDTAFAINAIWQIGDNADPIPRNNGYISLVNQAQDHSGGLDLSGADFEWYSPGAGNDLDNPQVANLEIIFSYTPAIWVLHNRGFRSYAIGYLGTTKADFLQNYKYGPTYPRPGDTAGTNPMVVVNTYAFPNSWIADGVNLSPTGNWEWNTLYNTIDAGYTGIDADNGRFGKSVKRKKVGNILQDTNNSTNDFTYGGSTAVAP